MSAPPGADPVPRVLILVCDSFGVGDAPDAASYGDEGSDTLGNTARAVGGIDAPNLGRLGLGLLTEIEGVAPHAEPGTAHGRLTERSAGKDTTTGHWEMAGIVLDAPFPLYPEGFPAEIMEPFSAAIGREVLGNVPASGTEIIAELGEEHLRTGRPIVYTSGDSVFQIATHTDVVPLQQLYDWCRAARRLLVGPHNVGRVIARPFSGPVGEFVRRPERRDFSVPPPGPTLLDRCRDAGIPVYGVGKIQDIFSHQGLTEARYSDSNDHGMDLTLGYLSRPPPSLVVSNLVDFDSKYGHRNDPDGYARAVQVFDRRLPELIQALDGGVLFLTGDHGCDPTTPSTDHSRERTPLLVAGLSGGPYDVGSRSTFADLGATAAELLGVRWDLDGRSFAGEIGR
ncbi:MAG TPA: phosphopentomutase [Actinomycetota bacterium]|nr:phosphopentomutase [Actinomycetota bacterium]